MVDEFFHELLGPAHFFFVVPLDLFVFLEGVVLGHLGGFGFSFLCVFLFVLNFFGFGLMLGLEEREVDGFLIESIF